MTVDTILKRTPLIMFDADGQYVPFVDNKPGTRWIKKRHTMITISIQPTKLHLLSTYDDRGEREQDNRRFTEGQNSS
jgi:hypothetical protein